VITSIIVFSSNGCQVCDPYYKRVERIFKNMPDVKTEKRQAEECPDDVRLFQIRSTPVTIAMEGVKVKRYVVGTLNDKQIRALLGGE
jgi:hypothetical protein